MYSERKDAASVDLCTIIKPEPASRNCSRVRCAFAACLSNSSWDGCRGRRMCSKWLVSVQQLGVSFPPRTPDWKSWLLTHSSIIAHQGAGQAQSITVTRANRFQLLTVPQDTRRPVCLENAVQLERRSKSSQMFGREIIIFDRVYVSLWRLTFFNQGPLITLRNQGTI